jgi:hypothetical protein
LRQNRSGYAEIANLAKPDQIPHVLQIAAQFAGQLTNLSKSAAASDSITRRPTTMRAYWSNSISSNAFNRGFATNCRG